MTLKVITKKAMPPELIDRSWSRLAFTTALPAGSFEASVAGVPSVGFLRGKTDMSRLVVFPS